MLLFAASNDFNSFVAGWTVLSIREKGAVAMTDIEIDIGRAGQEQSTAGVVLW